MKQQLYYAMLIGSLVLLLSACSKSDAVENGPMVFKPDNCYIAGTMTFQGIPDYRVPYMISFDGAGDAHIRTHMTELNRRYTYVNGLLEIDYLGIKLRFDMNTMTPKGDIKTLSSSQPKNVDIVYAVVQKNAAPNLFAGKSFKQRTDGNTRSIQINFQPANNPAYTMKVFDQSNTLLYKNDFPYTLYKNAAFIYKASTITHFGVMIDGYIELIEFVPRDPGTYDDLYTTATLSPEQ